MRRLAEPPSCKGTPNLPSKRLQTQCKDHKSGCSGSALKWRWCWWKLSPLPARPRDLVFKFKKGVKRDPASFTVMKDTKQQWDTVHRNLKAQTDYQDVVDVVDLRCASATDDNIALFEEKQKHMCAVFERILQTDEGNIVLCSYDHDRNAQMICCELLHSMTVSAEAMVGSGELSSCLTAAKISDGT